MKKPKCYICGKVGEETSYIYHNDKLAHESCIIGMDWSIFETKYEEVTDEKLRRVVEVEITEEEIKMVEENPKSLECLVGKVYKMTKGSPERIREVLKDYLSKKNNE